MKNSENLRSKKFLKHLGLLCAVAVLLPGIHSSASAATYNWVGASGDTWDSGWTGASIPTTADDLTILGPLNAAGTLTIDVATTSAAKTINITDPSAVTLANLTSGADTTLTIQSGLTTGSGPVTIGSATANQGVLVALGAAQTWNIGSGGLTLNNSYSGAFTLTKTGTGTLTLNAANASTGTLTISAGTVVANGDTANVMVSGKQINFGGGVLNYKSTNSSANTQTLGAINVNGGANTITSEETGSGTSALTLGTITRAVGSSLNLVANSSSGASIVSSVARGLNTGIFYNGDYAYATAGGNVHAVVYGTDGNSATVAAGGIAANIGQSAWYSLAGNATASNQSGSAYKFLVSGSTLTHSTFGNGFLVSSGIGATTGFTDTVAGTIRIGSIGTGEAVFNAYNSIDTLIVSASVQNFNASTTSPVTKTGEGVVRFSGSNTYSGLTNVLQGTLRSTSANGLGFGTTATINQGASNKTVVSPGAILDLAPASTMTVNEVISLTDASLINSGSGTTTIDDGIATVNLTGLGTGTATSGTVSFGGTGSGAAATIALTGGAISAFSISNSGSGYTGTVPVTFTTTGSTGAAATAILTSVGLSGSNTIGGSGNLNIKAVVANGATSGGFTKTGAGTLTLSGVNIYTGGTTVSAGKLLVNNTSGSGTGAGTLLVQSTATLGGGNGAAFGGLTSTLGTATLTNYSASTVGIISGATTVASGGHLAPGNSVGTLTLATLNLNSGSVMDYEFNLASNDLTAITGAGGLTFGSVGLNLYQENSLTTFATAGLYNILDYNTSFTGTLSNLSVLNQDAGYSYTFLNDTTNTLIQLQIVAVPEPSTYALLGMGLAGLWFLRRRKKVSV